MSDPETGPIGVDATHLLLSYQWRALNYCLRLFGNVPLGQHFVHITLMAVHSRGWHPTVQELTAITGLARPSVSRHLSALIAAGLLRDEVDAGDRRRRLLKPTRRGEERRAELMASLTRLNVRVAELAARGSEGGGESNARVAQALVKMAELVRAGPAGQVGRADDAGTRPGRGRRRVKRKRAAAPR